MLEVMQYLRDNGFRTYIVTGGGQEFVRVYSERVYGVPPEQVVGSSIATTYVNTNGKPVLMREPKSFLLTMAPAKRSGSTSSSASGRRLPSVTPELPISSQAMPRCWNGRKPVMVRG